jgi:hypothetical protein
MKGKKEMVMDAYEFSTAVDVFNKFNDVWTEKVLALEKWSEKTEELNKFIKAINVPKLQPSNFFPICSMVKKLLNDSNVNV